MRINDVILLVDASEDSAQAKAVLAVQISFRDRNHGAVR